MTKEKQKLLNKCFEKSNFRKARELLLKELADNPNDHWLLTNIAMTYYEEKDYKRALLLSKDALAQNSKCPLVLWDYSCILDMNNDKAEAIKTWVKLIKRGVNSIAYSECGEGLPWARSLVNDCRYRIGLAYYNIGKRSQAIKYIQEHIDNRNINCKSIYNLRIVKQKLAKIKSAK